MKPSKTKSEIQDYVQNLLSDKEIKVSSSDFLRPWGGFFVIDTSVTIENFISTFYPELIEELTSTTLPLSPKILCVAPNKRLSWQYHNRRSELWKLIDGQAGYMKSFTDDQSEVVKMKINKTLTLAVGERHRLIGLEKWGIIAEIWKHSDFNHPSDEDDIVRLQDDFGR